MKLAAAKTYTVERDTIKGALSLKPLDGRDTAVLHFHLTDLSVGRWRLEGAMGENTITAELLQVGADTVWRLLQTRRTIIALKDGEDQ